MRTVPNTYARFEADIERWIATCVKSRTDGAHREVPLVKGNASLLELWLLLELGKSARIVPDYRWGPNRVESIAFSSPDARPATPVSPRTRRPVGQPLSGSGALARGPQPGARAITITVRRDRRPPTEIAPHFPHDLRDLLDDATKYSQVKRGRGQTGDADLLDELVRRGKAALAALAVAAGAYYVGTRFVAPRLLFLWGWALSSEMGEPKRLTEFLRAKREAEDVLNQISVIAKADPGLGGSAVNWKVLHEVVDPGVPAQIDDAACGPACAQMVLGDRGVDVSQLAIATEARQLQAGLKTSQIKLDVLESVLNDIEQRLGDPLREWEAGLPVVPGWTDKQIAEALSRDGSWIAQVRGELGPSGSNHFVVVDKIVGNQVYLRDPYDATQAKSGSRIRVSWTEFARHWGGYMVRAVTKGRVT